MYVLRGKAESPTKKYGIGDDWPVMTSGSGMDNELYFSDLLSHHCSAFHSPQY